jgi:hypothetical protein
MTHCLRYESVRGDPVSFVEGNDAGARCAVRLLENHVCTFDCGIVLVDEVALDQLDGEA